MVQNNYENIIDVKDLPENLRPNCLSPEIIPLMTCRDPQKKTDEILNATCKNKTCSSRCRFKSIVNLG